VERESRRGARSLKIRIFAVAAYFYTAKSFALKILPLTPLNGRF